MSAVHSKMFDNLYAARVYLKQNPESEWLDVSAHVQLITGNAYGYNYFCNLLTKDGNLRFFKKDKENQKIVGFNNWLTHPANSEKLAQWNQAGERDE